MLLLAFLALAAAAACTLEPAPSSAPLALGPEASHCTVVLQAGTYGPISLSNATNVTVLGAGSSQTVVSGGFAVPLAAVKSVNRLKVIDLKALGVTGYGELASGGLGQCKNNRAGLSVNGQRMTLARYPNGYESDGNVFLSFIEHNVTTTAPTQRLHVATEGVAARARAHGWDKATDMWLHGYWKWDWADNYVKVVDLKLNGGVTFVASNSTPPVDGFSNHSRFAVVNVLGELDQPGEYYLDRLNGTLFFLPPAGADTRVRSVVVSMHETALTLTNVSDVTVSDLTVSDARVVGVRVSDASRVRIERVVSTLHGDTGISVTQCVDCSVVECDVHDVGCTGISASAGDRNTLTAGNLTVSHAHVWRYANWVRCYTPGIRFDGVGNAFTYNWVHSAPHMAITGHGNDHEFAFNMIENTTWEVSDAGAFYTGRSWVDRGNVVHDNVFRHIRKLENVAGGTTVQAIYLDDEMSGYVIANNTFVNCSRGVFIGGGRDTVVVNNTFTDCEVNVHLDNRGMTWQKNWTLPGALFSKQLDRYKVTQPPWSEQYPRLQYIITWAPGVPVDNWIVGNRASGTTKTFLDVDQAQLRQWMSKAFDNH